MLFGSCCDGHVVKWRSSASTKIERIPLTLENQYNTVDCAGDGRKIVVAGRMTQIEIWDESQRKLDQCWTHEGHQCHDNTIYTARYFPYNSFNLYSGGWDRIVKFWDVRHGHITSQALGTMTCSDSIDMNVDGHTLVTGGKTGEGL